MSLIPDIIAQEVERVLVSPALVRPADPKYGDYQANGVMAVAKQQKRNPREMAESVIRQLQLGHICEPPTVAGPGFINFRLKPECVTEQVNRAARDERHGVPATASPRTVVIDFCGVNIAKPMHVGHIRSTIIGDCLARVLGWTTTAARPGGCTRAACATAPLDTDFAGLVAGAYHLGGLRLAAHAPLRDRAVGDAAVRQGRSGIERFGPGAPDPTPGCNWPLAEVSGVRGA